MNAYAIETRIEWQADHFAKVTDAETGAVLGHIFATGRRYIGHAIMDPERNSLTRVSPMFTYADRAAAWIAKQHASVTV